MKICPQCQTEYDDTRKFCRHDGSPLEAKKTDAEITQVDGLTCPQCGKPVDVGKKFCRYCGARLEASTQSLAVETESEAPTVLVQTRPLAEEKLDPKTATKVELLEKQLAEEPVRLSVIMDLAEGYLEAGRGRQAAELLERAVSQQGEDVRIHLLLGKVRESVGDDQGALDAYLAALQRDMWNPWLTDKSGRG